MLKASFEYEFAWQLVNIMCIQLDPSTTTTCYVSSSPVGSFFAEADRFSYWIKPGKMLIWSCFSNRRIYQSSTWSTEEKRDTAKAALLNPLKIVVTCSIYKASRCGTQNMLLNPCYIQKSMPQIHRIQENAVKTSVFFQIYIHLAIQQQLTFPLTILKYDYILRVISYDKL